MTKMKVSGSLMSSQLNLSWTPALSEEMHDVSGLFSPVLSGDGDTSRWWWWFSLDCHLSCACIQAEGVSDPPLPQRRCRTEWWYPLVPFGDLRQNLGRCRRTLACPLPRGGLAAAPRSRSTAARWWKQLALKRLVKRPGDVPLSTLWIYLDLVEILSCVERDNIVGRDARNGLICGVPCSVEGQRCLTWDHLGWKTTRTVTSLNNEALGPGPRPGGSTWKQVLQRSQSAAVWSSTACWRADQRWMWLWWCAPLPASSWPPDRHRDLPPLFHQDLTPGETKTHPSVVICYLC